MGRHAEWEVVSRKDGIVMIQDLDRPGCLSITNDAEYVWRYFNLSSVQTHRVIYRSTIPDDWTEIVMTVAPRGRIPQVEFRPWYGEVWDKLTR
jgi:hypothetical protein